MVEGEGFEGVAVGDVGAEDGVPEEGGAAVGDGEEDGAGVREEAEAAVDGDEPRREVGGVGMVEGEGGEELGVDLLGLPKGRAFLKKKVEGGLEFGGMAGMGDGGEWKEETGRWPGQVEVVTTQQP